MSYNSTAVVFYGFPLEDAEERVDEVEADPKIKTGTFGDCHGEMTEYICIAESERRIELGASVRLDDEELPGPLDWDEALLEFCQKADIDWPDDGPGWHVAPKYT